MFKYVVERHAEGVVQHIIANSVCEVQTVLSSIPKEERGGTYPLYTLEDLNEKREDTDEIEG